MRKGLKPMPDDAKDMVVPTWRDFPRFYENEAIKELGQRPWWTVSSPDKMPIDMYHLINGWDGKIWGLAFNRGYHPMVDLETLCGTIPSAINNAYYLDCLRDGMVVMDIEPSCPKALQDRFLRLPYLYGERSMSGKGLHLLFRLPADILDKYPAARTKLALKHESGYYEILLNHMVTFTRNVLPDMEHPDTERDFRTLFEELAARQVETIRGDKIDMDGLVDEADIPKFDALMLYLRGREYKKKASDFTKSNGAVDRSRYEFGMAGFYYGSLRRAVKGGSFANETYTDEMMATMVYKVLREKLEERGDSREKHDTPRNGMPFLLFLVCDLIAKTKAEEATRPKGGGRHGKGQKT